MRNGFAQLTFNRGLKIHNSVGYSEQFGDVGNRSTSGSEYRGDSLLLV